MKQTLTLSIPVEGYSKFYCSEEQPVSEFLARIQRALDKVPAPYRDGATIEFRVDGGGYDESPTGSVCVEYKRPETDEELSVRLARDESHRQHRLLEERQVYERLKAKFER